MSFWLTILTLAHMITGFEVIILNGDALVHPQLCRSLNSTVCGKRRQDQKSSCRRQMQQARVDLDLESRIVPQAMFKIDPMNFAGLRPGSE